MGNLTQPHCTVSQLYDAEDFEVVVNQRQNELKRQRARRRAERRLRRTGLVCGVLLAAMLTIAVAAMLGLV